MLLVAVARLCLPKTIAICFVAAVVRLNAHLYAIYGGRATRCGGDELRGREVRCNWLQHAVAAAVTQRKGVTSLITAACFEPT
jgi:hypothetical protein